MTERPTVHVDKLAFHEQLDVAIKILASRDDIGIRDLRLSNQVAPLCPGWIREVLSRSARWINRYGLEVGPHDHVVEALTEKRLTWSPPFRHL